MQDISYFYVILRKDMFPFGPENHAYEIIQAAHAAFEIGRRLPAPAPGEPPTTMALLEVADEAELIEAMRKLRFEGLIEGHDFYTFFEPDHATGFTAIATRPINDKELRRFFRQWNMYGQAPTEIARQRRFEWEEAPVIAPIAK